MTRSCRLEHGGEQLAASWELTAATLSLFPEGRPAEAVPLAEVHSVGWDEWSVRLGVGGAELVLSRLGAEKDGLVTALRRTWPPLRAAALRVAGDGAPQRFTGSVATPDHPELTPAEVLLWPEALVVAPRGRDLEVLPLAHVAEVTENGDAWTVTVRQWDGSARTFSRLAGDTTRLVEALGAARAALAARATEALAASLPGLDPARRTSLAAHWPPGRLLSPAVLETLAPGFAHALAASWLPSLPRSPLPPATSPRSWRCAGRSPAASSTAASPPGTRPCRKSATRVPDPSFSSRGLYQDSENAKGAWDRRSRGLWEDDCPASPRVAPCSRITPWVADCPGDGVPWSRQRRRGASRALDRSGPTRH